MSPSCVFGYSRWLAIVVCCIYSLVGHATCRDNVVLVHGNASSPDSWENTYRQLLDNGYQPSEIFRPHWGSIIAANNNHLGWEEEPVREALVAAVVGSCSGRIDVIAHSMGVTLAAQQIIKLGAEGFVDVFVGVAGAYRGVWSCGIYPFNVPNSTCGTYGSSVSSPFIDWLYGRPIADTVYSIKSWSDQVICSTGFCTVGGVHTSRIANETASFTYPYGHFGLQRYTYDKQVELIQ